MVEAIEEPAASYMPRTGDGSPCRSAPMRGEDFCFFHSPAHEEEADEARRLGGLRRRKEKTLAGAYEFGGLATVPDIRRLLEMATLDTLALENSVARAADPRLSGPDGS